MENLKSLFAAQKAHQQRVRNTSASERIEKLKRLRAGIFEFEAEIKKAIHDDYGKNPTEVDVTEILPTIGDINHTIRHLKKWMKPKSVRTPLTLLGTRSEIRSEPKGVVLIIGPWNYPFSLLMIPLASAIAAGNCVILKPSELTSNTSRVIAQMIAKIFDSNEVAVVEGGVPVTQELLKLPFDHFFFTGSTRVGKLVMQAATEFLSSVTLELGGKSPAIFDETADLKSAAKTVVWSKFMNAGQTCVAPDYFFVPASMNDEFVSHVKAGIAEFYGASPAEQAKSRDICRIINAGNYNRLKSLIEKSAQQGAKIAAGGTFDDQKRLITPTILTEVTPESAIMEEEIFGPILPVLTYNKVEEVLSLISSKDKPLALYVYSKDRNFIERILGNTYSGGAAVNNAVIHLLNPDLPFGGAGPSGVGNYHGLHGFDAFSHQRAVLRQVGPNLTALLYPPYTERVRKMVRLLINHFV